MLDKVSNTSRMNLISSEEAFRRESITKNTASAFEIALSKSAKKAASSGLSVEEIAGRMKLSVPTVKSLIAMQFEVPLTRKERQEMRDEESYKYSEAEDDESVQKKAQEEEHQAAQGEYLTAAEQAYEEMYGKSLAKKKSPLLAHGKSIQKSRKGDWSGDGGPKRQMRYNNSIWDADILAATAKKKDNGERIREERAAIDSQRKQARYEQTHISTDDLKRALEDGDMRKSASVRNSSETTPDYGGYKYGNKVQKNGVSMFDDEPFERIAQKTDGEMEREKNRAPKKKNREWAKVSSSNSTKNLFQKMVDSMIDEEE